MSTNWPIVFMGTPQIAADTLERLCDGPDSVVGVVTQPDRPSGRGQKTAPPPVHRIAEARGIPVVAPEKIRTPEFLDVLRAWQPMIIVVVAYGRILPKTILELAPHGCLNVHYSLLPKYRGAAPAAWTIINGELQGGVTTMRLGGKNGRWRHLFARRASSGLLTKPPARCKKNSHPSALVCSWKPFADSSKER